VADGAEALQIVRFVPKDESAVRALVLDGLAERWGGPADPGLNPDLDDIAGSYATGTTLVARLNGLLVGTGSVLPREPGLEEVVRMSVAPAARGRGIGTQLLGTLVDAAAARGARRIVCVTCAHWESAVRLYLRSGFTITHYSDGDFCRDAHLSLDLR
jgi:ribosomal protein S18 acetylase RimI-like enzyme